MDRRRFLAAVGGVLVAGCSGAPGTDGADTATPVDSPEADPQTATPTESPTPTRTPSPTPTPTRSPTPTPSPTETPTPPLHTEEVIERLNAPALGPEDAPVRMAAYDDFACPHCRAYNLSVFPNVREFIEDGTVRYAHVDFPIPVSEWSEPVNNAAREVYDQADAATFFDYSHDLYENQNDYDYELLESLAGSLETSAEIDAAAVRDAAEEGTHSEIINRNREFGSDVARVRGTPTVFLNGEKVNPAWSNLKDAIPEAAE